MLDVKRSEVTVKTRDDFPIAATRFDPPEGVEVRAAVVFGPATGVYGKFYNDFASWVASNGVASCTFDYRYFGASFPPPFKPSTFTPEERDDAMRACPTDVSLTGTWAKVDFAAVVRYMSDLYPDVPLTVFGNSLGCHLMPLFPEEWPRITRFLSACGGNAYFGNTNNPKAARFTIQGAIRQELETSRLFPAEWLGLGRTLPYGPGNEWCDWSDHPHFALHHKEDVENVRRLTGKQFLYIGFEDDDTLNKKMMLNQMGLYSHSDGLKHSLWIDPAAQNPPWPPCKHVMSFMKTKPSASSLTKTTESNVVEAAVPKSELRREETIWPVYLAYILDGTIDSSLGEHKVWTPEDERDIEAERKEHERFVRQERRDKAAQKRWNALTLRNLWGPRKERMAPLSKL